MYIVALFLCSSESFVFNKIKAIIYNLLMNFHAPLCNS